MNTTTRAPLTPVQPDFPQMVPNDALLRWAPFIQAAANPSASAAHLAPIPYEFIVLAEYIHQHCRGLANARGAKHLARACFLPPNGRKVRQLISLYQDRCPYLILGAQGKGFFVPDDLPASATSVRRTLYSQIRANAQRITQLDRICRLHHIQRVGSGPAALYCNPPLYSCSPGAASEASQATP
jgi:hypothetical protein